MYETILNLHTVEECVNFFEDLCAATELSAMEQRFDVASLLLEGRVSTEIMDTTKASSATVSATGFAPLVGIVSSSACTALHSACRLSASMAGSEWFTHLGA